MPKQQKIKINIPALFRLVLLGVFTLTLLGGLSSRPAAAQEADNKVKIRLLAERGTIAPGETLWIGIEESIAPHWHTYWVNPGDSGSHTKAGWALPEGFAISDFHWPTPKKIPYGPLSNYGYEDNVVFLQKLTAPAELPAGPITLTADIELLVCDEICIPEYGTYELTLNDPAAMEEDNTAFFDMARAKLPQKVDWKASYSEHENMFHLRLHSDNVALLQAAPKDIALYPLDWGILSNPAQTHNTINAEDETVILTQARGDRPLSAIENFSGVIAFETEDGTRQSFQFTATPGSESFAGAPAGTTSATTSGDTSGPASSSLSGLTLWAALLSALLGGLILNLMPCVFPVLSIKALSLVKTAEKEPALARMHGIAYTFGVVLSFLLIAGILIALQAGGASIGWGFQLQNPVIVGALAYLLFLVGLNLMGVFELSPRFTNFGNKLTQGQNVSNSFFTGVLATLVATPCTAPFMGAAIGFALIQPALIGLTVFAALGFGLALPYLLLSFIPGLQHALPKPGAWMDRFKEFLAFPMFASSAWLVWVLSQQTGSSGVLMILIGFTLIGFMVWLIRHLPHQGRRRHVAQILIALVFIIVIALLPRVTSHHQGLDKNSMPKQSTQQAFGESFSHDKLASYLEGDAPIFVEMTAAWCITCKYNHAVAINVSSTKALFAERGVKYLIGDWTNQDPAITKYLKKYGRSGVPLYVYYGPRGENGQRPEGELLPQILTPGTIRNYFK